MGNIIGGGIFTLPAAVAPYGTVSLLAFVVLSVAAVLLALLFGKLARRSPVTGGLYVYPRDAFGPFAGFLSAWSYWTMCWVSIAALAVGVVGYVDVLIPWATARSSWRWWPWPPCGCRPPRTSRAPATSAPCRSSPPC